jgi:uncharacterized membrane protein YeiB
VHHIFIWGGDILFSYAVAAVGLLIVLYGNWKVIGVSMLALIVLGMIPALDSMQQVAASLALLSVAALFLRGEWMIDFLGRQRLTFSVVFLCLGALLVCAAVGFWLIPGAPKGPRIPLTVMAVVMLAIGFLSGRFHDPIELRARRLGVALYLFPFLIMTTFGTIQYLWPEKPPAGYSAAAVAAAATPAATAIAKAATAKPAAGKAAAKPEKTELQKYLEKKAKRAENRKKDAAQLVEETRIESRGTYLELVRMRAREFAERAPGEAGFAFVLCGMFLLGSWFVRSGIMENTGAHLPFFRKLAIYGTTFGVGIGMLSGYFGNSPTPGLDNDPFQIAMGLRMIGNLPACLGYVGIIVLMLHSGTALAKISVLAPLGRMALTNYLTASIVGTLYFYGYAFGHWGMGRANQVLFVAVVISVQLAFSHWWLSKFRYGPMEWLWRAITYWQLPPMRRDDLIGAVAA